MFRQTCHNVCVSPARLLNIKFLARFQIYFPLPLSSNFTFWTSTFGGDSPSPLPQEQLLVQLITKVLVMTIDLPLAEWQLDFMCLQCDLFKRCEHCLRIEFNVNFEEQFIRRPSSADNWNQVITSPYSRTKPGNLLQMNSFGRKCCLSKSRLCIQYNFVIENDPYAVSANALHTQRKHFPAFSTRFPIPCICWLVKYSLKGCPMFLKGGATYINDKNTTVDTKY